MRKLHLLLMAILLLLCSACSDDIPPQAKTPSTPLTETEARASLQTWLDGHPFNPPVTIGDSLTDENETGFVFTLYQDGELTRIRVIKDTGALLRHDPEKDQYIAINDWYTNLDKYNPQNLPVDETSAGEPGTDNPYPGEILYKGVPVRQVLHGTADDVKTAFGEPTFDGIAASGYYIDYELDIPQNLFH